MLVFAAGLHPTSVPAIPPCTFCAVAEHLTPLDDARALVLSAMVPLSTVEAELADAIGCVVAVDAVSEENVPPFANTAVDGYAVVASSTDGASPTNPVQLAIIGEIAAGASGADIEVGAGQAVRIMTGAPMPSGADAVVMVEDTVFDGDRRSFDGSQSVSVLKTVSGGDGVRAAGSDVKAGDTVVVAGTVVTPAIAGVLASINVRRPSVTRRPRVAVLSTGDELVDDGSPLEPGEIRESNKVMLLGLVEQAGVEAVDYGIVRDDEAVLESVLRRAADECDAIVTSGGVSMGDYDVVKAVLSRIADMTWMQIAIKPAKPFAFGLLASGTRRVPVFGLPGNPVSSLVSFELLARPALRTMAGHPPASVDRPRVVAVADTPLRRSRDGKVHWQRVVASWGADGRVHIAPVAAQGSHQLAASALANALAAVPDGDGVPAGGEVPVLLLVT